MFKQIFSKIKNAINGDIFSSISILPFSKYKKNYSQSDYLSAYEISLYVNRALNIRAEKVGEIEFTVLKGDNDIPNDPVLDLFAKPNKAFTGAEFWKLYQKYFDIFGEVYIQKDGEYTMGGNMRVSALHLLRSDLCKPHFDEMTGKLSHIEYRTGKGTETYQGDEIIYSHNPDPANPLRGESLLRAGIRQIETGTQIDEYHSKVLENGGRVEGVFKFKTGTLTKDQLKNLKDRYQEEYGNASKSGMPLFLAGDADYEKVGLSPSELAYLETKKVNLDDICILTGVPKALLGLTSGETFANSDASIRIFLRETIKPLLKSLATKLDEDFVEEGKDLGFVDPTPEDKDDKRKDAESGIKNFYMTPNEARELVGLEARPEGDVLLVPFNLMELGSTPETTPAKSIKKKDFNHPLRDKDNRVLYHALCVKRLDRRQTKFKNVIDGYFKGQRDRLIEKLSAQKTFKKKDLLGEIFAETTEIKLAKETVLPILAEMLKEAAKDAKDVAGSDWEFNETADIQSWLDNKTEIFAESINKTTFKKLKKEFSDSLEAGETRKQLIERIAETYGGISDGRAATIARTEVHGVTQYGTKQGYKQAGLPIKIWVWAPGTMGGVRDEHQAMDGEEKAIDTHFSNGLDFPGDTNAPAAETINCQCFI